MNKRPLLASIASMPDDSPGGIVATAMRYLARTAPDNLSGTLIFADGSARWISRDEAERYASGPDLGEVRQ